MADREVVLRFTGQVDPSVQQAYGQVAQQAIAMQKIVDNAVGRAAKQREADKQAYLKQLGEEAATAVKWNASVIEDRRRRETEATKEHNKRIAESCNLEMIARRNLSRLAQQSRLEEEKAIKRTALAQDTLHKAEEKFFQRLALVGASRYGLAQSTTHVLKGMHELFGENVKGAKQLVELMEVMHGIYNTMRGAIHAVQGLVAAWAAYRAMIEASAAAHGKLAAAEAASLALGAPGGGRGGVAVAAGAGAAGAKGYGLAAGVGGMFGTLGINASTGLGAILLAPLVAGVGATRAKAGIEESHKEQAEKAQAFSDALRRHYDERYRQEQQLNDLYRQRREAVSQLEQSSFQRGETRAERLRDISLERVQQGMRGWSAAPGARQRNEPGAAGYASVEEAIARDRSAGQSLVGDYEKQLLGIRGNVANANTQYNAAEAERNLARNRQVRSRGRADYLTYLRDQYMESAWGTNWAESLMYGSNAIPTILGKKIEGAQGESQILEERAGRAQAAMEEAARQKEDYLKQEKDMTEKIAEVKQAQAQRDIKNAEDYLNKLREMHEQHLRNAEAIEKGARSLSAQMVLDPKMGRKLTRAARAYSAGTASNKQLAMLMSKAAPEQAEQFEAELAARGGNRDEALEVLGWGGGAAAEERRKADVEQRKIKETQDYIAKAREAAMMAADTMANRVAKVMQELFDAMSKRFEIAIEKAKNETARQIKEISTITK